MAGIDNGTSQGGIYFQAKQFGSILRGNGPPVPQAGLVGDLYLDVAAWNLYTKRSTEAGSDVDPWGHFLFNVPVTYRNQLKWFSASAPGDSVGVTGDYCLAWAGFGNYGLQPAMYGPKTAFGVWAENGNGPNTSISNTGAGFVLPIGLADEGAPIALSSSTQLIVIGIVDEYVQPTPVGTAAGTPVLQIGIQSNPANVAVTLNALYTAEDSHAL
jgi:hypothetical protein